MNLSPVSASLYPVLRRSARMIPAKIMKKPAMLIPAPVGMATSTQPRMMSVEKIVMSLIERTLVNVFSILLSFISNVFDSLCIRYTIRSEDGIPHIREMSWTDDTCWFLNDKSSQIEQLMGRLYKRRVDDYGISLDIIDESGVYDPAWLCKLDIDSAAACRPSCSRLYAGRTCIGYLTGKT